MFQLIPFLSYAFVTSFTPGPNNIMSMTTAKQHGLKQSLYFILGVSAGFFIIMMLSCYFDMLLFKLIPQFKTFMEVFGAAYLLYLAYKVAHSKSDYGDGENPSASSFFSGLWLQFINPKAILYGITVTSSFIIPFFSEGIHFVLFSLFLAIVALAATFCWAFFGIMLQKYLRSYNRPINLALALLLVYCAVSVTGLV